MFEKVEATLSQVKDLQAQIKATKKTESAGLLPEDLSSVSLDLAYPCVVYRKDGLDAGGMRNLWDMIHAKLGDTAACVLASDNDGTPLLLAAASDAAVEQGFNAGAVIKEISRHIKGGGGGKPTMAQAGGKDASGLDGALDAARAFLKA